METIRNLSLNHSAEGLRKARKLRREMSASERVLWERLRKNRLGFSFKRQVAVGAYVLDFYSPEASLCIEVDGEQHVERRLADAKRDAFLEKKGIGTLRIPSLDLFDPVGRAISHWLDRIQSECELRAQRPAYNVDVIR